MDAPPLPDLDASVGAFPESPVRVIRSARRRKTAQARLLDGVLEVRIPDRCSTAEEEEFVDHFRARFRRSRQAAQVDLEQRAAELARDHGLPVPSSIRWVSNQAQRWGSCTPAQGTVRLSDRMASYPQWVIDYVIVHELAHLVEFGHGPDFHALVDRYPLSERAQGYLLAKSDGL
jgi:predicted metal-dependent hydrolase